MAYNWQQRSDVPREGIGRASTRDTALDFQWRETFLTAPVRRFSPFHFNALLDSGMRLAVFGLAGWRVAELLDGGQRPMPAVSSGSIAEGPIADWSTHD